MPGSRPGASEQSAASGYKQQRAADCGPEQPAKPAPGREICCWYGGQWAGRADRHRSLARMRHRGWRRASLRPVCCTNISLTPNPPALQYARISLVHCVVGGNPGTSTSGSGDACLRRCAVSSALQASRTRDAVEPRTSRTRSRRLPNRGSGSELCAARLDALLRLSSFSFVPTGEPRRLRRC